MPVQLSSVPLKQTSQNATRCTCWWARRYYRSSIQQATSSSRGSLRHILQPGSTWVVVVVVPTVATPFPPLHSSPGGAFFLGLKYCEKTHIEVRQKEEANQNYFHCTVSLRGREGGCGSSSSACDSVCVCLCVSSV